jgi:hypothetical protein
MSRLAQAWRSMDAEQRIAAVASLALLVTMFFPWYGLQSVNRKGEISSHTINAFGDISFVEAAVFLVAAGVVLMALARAEGREFHMPGGDGTIVMIAGGWAALLIFYRVFSRPAGNHYPVGIEWGFFLAFVSAGALTYAGWRMRSMERPEPPARSGARRPRRGHPPEGEPDATSERAPERGHRADTGARAQTGPVAETDPTLLVPAAPRPRAPRPAPVTADRRPAVQRPRYPPAPASGGEPGAEQLSFEDSPPRSE